MSKSDQIQISLTTLAYGGDCLGRLPDGRAAFVPYALPGETVAARLLEEKRGHVRAEMVELLQPSPERISPRCPHYFVPGGQLACGGCHYQHLSLPSQLRAKTGILRDQLARIGGIADPPVLPAVSSPQVWNYRNHIQFHLSPQGKLGFEALRSSTVCPIQECHLPETALNAIWPQIDLQPIPGLERLALRLGADDEVLLVCESDEPLNFLIEDLPISAVQLSSAGRAVLAGSDYLIIGGESASAETSSQAAQSAPALSRPFHVSADSFFQVNTLQAAAMAAHLLAELPLASSTTLLDLYCGVGLFSAYLADKVARLVGVEISPSACADFAINLDEFDNVELYQAAVEDALPALDIRPQVIVLDPPRAGVDRRALDAILALGAETIAYVSCDPATLARDARRLAQGGYHLRQITPFDLFPQTYHIESISFWEKSRQIE